MKIRMRRKWLSWGMWVMLPEPFRLGWAPAMREGVRFSVRGGEQFASAAFGGWGCWAWGFWGCIWGA